MGKPHNIDIDSLCSEIANALAHCEGEYVAKIANQVLPDQTVKYKEDSVFTIERNDIEDEEEE